MTTIRTIALAGAACIAFAGAAHAQRAADLGSIDVTAAVGEIGPGWVKKQAGPEGVTYVCETDACGGRGVVGIGQAKAETGYIKELVANPDKGMQSYKYGIEESMKPSGCSFASFDVARMNDRRVRYESKGTCPEGVTALMTTIFDADRSGMMSVQVVTKSEAEAVKLRDASLTKLVTALDKPAE